MKSQKNQQLKGFSLIELMVVLSIAAVLSTVGLLALTRSSNYQITRELAEDIKTKIRTAQSNAISTEGSCGTGGGKPKMWSITISPADYTLGYYCDSDGWHDHDTDSVYFEQKNFYRTFNGSTEVSPGADGTYTLVYSSPTGDFNLINGIPDGGLQYGLTDWRARYDMFHPTGDVASAPLDITIKRNGDEIKITIDNAGGAS